MGPTAALAKALQRRIQLAPLRIAGLVGSHIGWIGLDALRHFDGLAAGRVEIGPVSGAHAGHQRAAEGAAFFGREDLDRLAVDAGLNLAATAGRARRRRPAESALTGMPSSAKSVNVSCSE